MLLCPHGAEGCSNHALCRVCMQVGSNSSCQQYLQASWSVCSLPLGSGTGPVRVQLPSPTAIANLTASPLNIASAGNAASQVPLGLPTASQLSVLVAFSDNTVRDFSRDVRTTFAVTTGSSTCNVVAGGSADLPDDSSIHHNNYSTGFF
eukprot:GHRQ01032553.1.p2 GENE.GHRQ01032553.1~~GHRQ01032553.1.p2  ORF type:complete len:149 (-),score=48.28 GHRQ01032553.1:186-632(-)